MEGQQLELPMPTRDDLADGRHERCAHCKARFPFDGAQLVRVRALDGKWYCNEVHASAPYAMW